MATHVTAFVRSNIRLILLLLLVAVAGCEPAASPPANSEAPAPIGTDAPPVVEAPPVEQAPVVESPAPAEPPAEVASQDVVEIEAQPLDPQPDPTPAAPSSEMLASAAALREEGMADALAGRFQAGHEKLQAAAALVDDAQTQAAIELLAGYLQHDVIAEGERAQEYAAAAQRAQRAMMVQAYLDDNGDGELRADLEAKNERLRDTYQRMASPDGLGDVPTDEAQEMKSQSMAAASESLVVLDGLRSLLQDEDGEYAAQFKALIDELASHLEHYRQVWSETDLTTPEGYRTGVRRIRLSENELAYAMADVDLMASETPWRMALAQAALAKDVAGEADRLTDQPWFRQLVLDTEQRGQGLIEQSEWLNALAAYVGLEALDQSNEEYKQMVSRVRKHVRVLGLYGQGALDEDDDEPDTDVPAREIWRDMIDGIGEQMVRTVISRVDSFYVTTIDYRVLIDGALTSIQVLVDTPQASSAFPALADDEKCEAFREKIAQARRHITQKPDPLDHLDLLLALKNVLDASDETVQLPVGVLCMEFTDGFISELDEFSQPIWPDDVSQFNKMTRGHFTGVGIQVSKEPGEPLKVVTPLPGTPAFNAGIQMGDEVLEVDGVETNNLAMDDIINMIVGVEGTTVVLRVRRRGTVSPVDIPVVRATIKIASVKGWRQGAGGEWDYMLDHEHGIGYLRVARFSEETASDIVDALRELQAQDVQAVVLDLRLNPGGLLRAATRTTNEFVDHGRIVMTRGRNVRRVEIKANWRGQYIEGPLVVLVDEYSASASEIVSGALQDIGRAIVIGQRSYGKGSVQQVLQIASAPKEAMLKLTSAYYYVGPSERLVHRRSDSET